MCSLRLSFRTKHSEPSCRTEHSEPSCRTEHSELSFQTEHSELSFRTERGEVRNLGTPPSLSTLPYPSPPWIPRCARNDRWRGRCYGDGWGKWRLWISRLRGGFGGTPPTVRPGTWVTVSLGTWVTLLWAICRFSSLGHQGLRCGADRSGVPRCVRLAGRDRWARLRGTRSRRAAVLSI